MSASALRPGASRLLVVSHPAVVAANQGVYAGLLELGWDLRLVVPARWRHEYSPDSFAPQTLPELDGRLFPVPIVGAGRPQRHAYRVLAGRLIAGFEPELAFLEQEPFSISALQWGSALARAGVPFGVQSDENLDRALPWPAALIQRAILPRAAFVAARSPASAGLIQRRAGRLDIRVIPHAVPEWAAVPEAPERRFTVGFAGRLVAEKGLDTLTAALHSLGSDVRVRIYGDGPLREQVERDLPPAQDTAIITGLPHERMAEAFADMDVLVLPSRTTPTWAEQFGRVLVEALWCGVPVVGSESGEIPWVIATTGGGCTFPEGDAEALARRLAMMRDDPRLRSEMAARGRRAVAARFSVSAVARAFDDQLRHVLAK